MSGAAVRGPTRYSGAVRGPTPGRGEPTRGRPHPRPPGAASLIWSPRPQTPKPRESEKMRGGGCGWGGEVGGGGGRAGGSGAEIPRGRVPAAPRTHRWCSSPSAPRVPAVPHVPNRRPLPISVACPRSIPCPICVPRPSTAPRPSSAPRPHRCPISISVECPAPCPLSPRCPVSPLASRIPTARVPAVPQPRCHPSLRAPRSPVPRCAPGPRWQPPPRGEPGWDAALYGHSPGGRTRGAGAAGPQPFRHDPHGDPRSPGGPLCPRCH